MPYRVEFHDTATTPFICVKGEDGISIWETDDQIILYQYSTGELTTADILNMARPFFQREESDYRPESGRQGFVAPMKDALIDMSMAYDSAHQPGGEAKAQELYDRFIQKWFALNEMERKIFLNQMNWDQFDRMAHQFRWLAGSGKIDPHDMEKFTEDLIKRGGMTPAFRRKILKHQEEVRGTSKMVHSERDESERRESGFDISNPYIVHVERQDGMIWTHERPRLMQTPPTWFPGEVFPDERTALKTIPHIVKKVVSFPPRGKDEQVDPHALNTYEYWVILEDQRSGRESTINIGTYNHAMREGTKYYTIVSSTESFDIDDSGARALQYGNEPLLKECLAEIVKALSGRDLDLDRRGITRQYYGVTRYYPESPYLGERAIKMRKERVKEAKAEGASKYPDESYGVVTAHMRRSARERRQDTRSASECQFKSACMSEFGMSSSDFDKYADEAGRLKIGTILGTGFALYNPLTLIPFLFFRLRGDSANDAMNKAFQLWFDIAKAVIPVFGGAKMALAMKAVDKPFKAMTDVEVKQAGSAIRAVMRDPQIFRAAVRSLRHIMTGLRRGKITEMDLEKAAEEGVNALAESTYGESLYDLIAVLPDLGIGPGDVDAEQLRMGIEVEKEHTMLPAEQYDPFAERIALAHLQEDPKYYTHLDEMEKKYDAVPGFAVAWEQLYTAMQSNRPDVMQRFERAFATADKGGPAYATHLRQARALWSEGKYMDAERAAMAAIQAGRKHAGLTMPESGDTIQEIAQRGGEMMRTKHWRPATGANPTMPASGYKPSPYEEMARDGIKIQRKPAQGRNFVAVFEDARGMELNREQNDRKEAFEECIMVTQSRHIPYVKAIWYDKDGKVLEERWANKDHTPYKW